MADSLVRAWRIAPLGEAVLRLPRAYAPDTDEPEFPESPDSQWVGAWAQDSLSVVLLQVEQPRADRNALAAPVLLNWNEAPLTGDGGCVVESDGSVPVLVSAYRGDLGGRPLFLAALAAARLVPGEPPSPTLSAIVTGRSLTERDILVGLLATFMQQALTRK